MYTVSRVYEDVLICAVLPQAVLLRKLLDNAVRTLIYLLCVEAAVILLLNYLVRRKVVDGIHRIIESLSAITDGNLDTTVEVGGNHEFEELSRGINTMVRSIINISNRISAIIEISGIPLAAFSMNAGQSMCLPLRESGSFWTFQRQGLPTSATARSGLTNISAGLRKIPWRGRAMSTRLTMRGMYASICPSLCRENLASSRMSLRISRKRPACGMKIRTTRSRSCTNTAISEARTGAIAQDAGGNGQCSCHDGFGLL